MVDVQSSRTVGQAALLEEKHHFLTQPLSSLQCRLEIGFLPSDETLAYGVLQESLQALKRVLAAMLRMRILRRASYPAGPSA